MVSEVDVTGAGAAGGPARTASGEDAAEASRQTQSARPIIRQSSGPFVGVALKAIRNARQRSVQPRRPGRWEGSPAFDALIRQTAAPRDMPAASRRTAASRSRLADWARAATGLSIKPGTIACATSDWAIASQTTKQALRL